MEWVTSKVVTTLVVMVIAVSFLGLFSMQATYYRSLEQEDVANAITDLVTEVDLLGCEAEVMVDWTNASGSQGLPRYLHGVPYIIQFTCERPYVVIDAHRVAGRYFPSNVSLYDPLGAHVDLLEVPSTVGFQISSEAKWMPWGLDFPISITVLH
jgi:hypothetical protein